MHDAISAEKLGIPAVGVITERFTPTAQAMAGFLGYPEYPVVCIAHPISDNTDAQIEAKAEAIFRQSLAILSHPSRGR
ncbi:MAG TPA: hypothetical protein VF937_00455 [Chloroflexota bacterium]